MIAYGQFLNTVINFLIVAMVVFLIVQFVNRMHKPVLPAKPVTKECRYCFQPIPIPASRCPFCTSQLLSVEKTRFTSY